MSSLGAIVLAAGMSRRMKGTKLVFPLHHKPIIQYATELAIHPLIDRTVIVTGAYAPIIKQYIRPDPKIEYVHNERYRSGMGSSLACGMREMEGRVDATFILLADQPCVPAHVIETIGSYYIEHKETDIKIIRPTFAGKEGHPILITASLFREFFSLSGDIGGRQIIEAHRKVMHTIPFSNRLWGQDVDTRAQLAWLEKNFLPSIR